MNAKIGRRLVIGGAFVALTPLLLLTIPSAEASTGTMVISQDKTLTADHSGEIEIKASNVTLNCNGHTIRDPGEVPGVDTVGISVSDVDSVTVKDCNVTGFSIALQMSNSSFNTIRGGTFRNGRFRGCALDRAHYNTIESGVAFLENRLGCKLDASEHNIFRQVRSSSNREAGFFLTDANNNHFIGNEVMHNETGFVFAGSDGNVLRNNTIDQNLRDGLAMGFSRDNVIDANSFSANNIGIIAGSASRRNNFSLNTVKRNVQGFYLDDADDNTFSGNNACQNRELDGVQRNSTNAFTNNRFDRVFDIPMEGNRPC